MLRTAPILTALLLISANLAAQAPLVREGDVWNFFRGTTEPPLDWNTTDFDPVAAGWESGPTGIGYGDDDDATILGDMQGAYVSVYMTIFFEVPEGLEDFVWALRVRYDDGFVAYMDGDEIARRGVDGFPPPFDATSLDHEITGPTGFDESILIDAPESGLNALAVQVHNTQIDSSDLSFSAELVVGPFLVSSITPAFGPLDGGNTVTILGRGFQEDDIPAVRFGDELSESVEVVSTTQLQVLVPPAVSSGPVDVEVEDSRGGVILIAGYRYSGTGQTGLEFQGGQFLSAGFFGDLFDEGTFEVWFRRDGDFFNLRRTLFSIAGPDGTDFFLLDARNNQVRARTWVGGDPVALEAPGPVGDGPWNHVAVTFSPDGRRIYLNGQLIGSDDLLMEIPEIQSLRVGQAWVPGGFFPTGLDGQMESIRVWSIERTEEEIARDIFARLSDESGLEAVWSFDEGVGQTTANLVPGGEPLVLGLTQAVEEADPVWIPLDDFPIGAITEVTPSSGPLAGGGTVRILGAGFTEAATVFFGNQESPAVEVLGPGEIEAVVPAGDGFGVVNIRVIVATGTIIRENGYSYEPENLTTAVREGDEWDYFIATFAPPFDWAEPDFEPGDEWGFGPTGIGYGDDDDATPVPEMQNLAIALYARTEFDVDVDPGDIQFLRLRIRYDDSFVAYLNGTEIERSNLIGEPPAFDETAADLHEITGGPGTFDEEFDISELTRLLVPGQNVLALEVHNFSLDSSDLSLSAELDFATGGGDVGSRFIRGDIDENGGLTVTDAVRILQALFLAGELRCPEAADVNDDSELNLSDAIYLLAYLFQGGDRPPPPFPLSGTDRDGDDLDCPEIPEG